MKLKSYVGDVTRRFPHVAMLMMVALVAGSCASARRALPTARPEAVGMSSTALAHITPMLQAHVDSGKMAGAIAVVARHGRLAYAEKVGYMDVERRTPMRMDAIFRIYSMTKPVLAVAVMRLVEDGRLTLEDPVARYIPAFGNVKVFAGGSADAPLLRDPDSVMTVRHLLTHTAGLGYGAGRTTVDTIYQRAALFNPASTLEHFADSIARLPLYFSPGTRFYYSAAIDVLGRVIEVASGQPLDAFLQQQIFDPLGMSKTSFRIRPDMRSRMTTLYQRGENGELEKVTGGLMDMFEPQARFFWGGGGLLSTVDDYLRFAQMLLNGGELNGRRVLRAESVAEIMRNHLPAALTPVRGGPMMDRGYGQGLAGAVLVDSTLATLPGATGIYRWSGYVGTYFWIDPRNQLIAMVWTQFTPGRTYPLEEEFQRLVYAALQN